MAKYLVTGAAGFIGSNLVEVLVARGEQVVALDNLATGKLSNLSPFQSAIDFREADIGDESALAKALAGVDYVLHQAALPSVPRSIEEPLRSHESNATGTLKLLIAARDAGVKRLVYASSSSVYGDSPTLPKHEEMPTRPLSPYAVNKLAGEEYCKVFTRVYGLPTVSLRYFNVFGPRQDPKSQYAAVIPAFITSMLRGEAPTIHGDGLQTRDFTYVSNVVEANLLACHGEGAQGEALNIACGEQLSLVRLVEGINRHLGTQIKPVFGPPRPGDVRDSLADITRARQLLGYEPRVSVEAGLKRTITFLSESLTVGPARGV